MQLSEYYGSARESEIHHYAVNQFGEVHRKKTQEKSLRGRWNLKSIFYDVFLPQGYPDSVSDDYLSYQIWDTLQAFCSSITGTLATQAVLKGSGVGDSSATAAAATITWLLKDGTGMVGRIAFAYMHGTGLDANAKQWRLFADVLNDCAIFVQLFASLLPKSYFTFLMCLSGLAFSLVGVAGGCTRAALTMHQAKRNNMADVSAKDGSQETLVNLAALITSLILTPLISGHLTTTWLLFVVFSLLHIYANYKAVSSVVMDIFNRIRFFTVVKTYLSSKTILTPLKANQAESVFFPPNCSWLNLGCKIEDLNLTAFELEKQMSEKNKPKYLIKLKKQTGKVYIALAYDATAEDMVRASYQSYLLRTVHDQSSKDDEDNFIHLLKRSGWNLMIQQLGANEWRWTNEDHFVLHKAEDKYV